MDALEAIRTRRSIRKYQPTPVPEDLIRQLLAAATSAPSAGNQQPWQFVVITDRAILAEIPKIHAHAQMVKDAPAAILVCGDLSFEKHPGFWVVDCSAAVENMLLAAHALGLGAVWTGVYPVQKRMQEFRAAFNLPEHVQPHSLVVLGYAAEQPPSQDRYREDRVHRNRW